MTIAGDPSPPLWQKVALFAALTVFCLLALGLWNALAPATMTPKSLQLPGALGIAAEAPLWALVFFLGDSLCVLSALRLFLSLAKLCRGSGWLIALGLLAAVIKAAADWVENLGLAWPALQLLLGKPALPLVEDWLTYLDAAKRLGGSVSALVFALLYPGHAPSGRIVRLLFYATAIFTFAGFFVSAFMQVNAMLLFFAAAAIAWDARRHEVP